MVNLGPGDHIESRCTRCSCITGHIITAFADGKIIKVECKSCKSIHKYYPPKTHTTNQKKEGMLHVRSGANRKETMSTFQNSLGRSINALSEKPKKSQKKIELVAEEWRRALNKSFGESKQYTMNGSFSLGDVIDHPTFGKGVVQSLSAPDKVQVLFCDGLKLLRCSIA